ncbi:MAG: phosphoesterase [Alphaproteobacteria bacterium 64-11]|nr:ligase-associated DNA damage response endonuclease PdeM [Alphaproteobacteria bacterium]OJU13859.1 MAG: phosphoesterase [Alphaproteobacteria bacterium 64-11]
MRCVLTDSGLVDSQIGDVLVDVNGETLLLDPCGAAFLPAHRTLVFADLHFEKGSAYARGRQFLPPYDTAATLLRVSRAAARHQPTRIIALGDSFHDGGAADRMGDGERALLAAIGAEWIWIAGNHDPAPPAWLGGTIAQEYRLGGLIFRHEPQLMFQPGEVAGHLHPCATVTKWGRGVRRRCFVSDGLRLVMPSFGAYTGGLDVGDPAIGSLFAGPFHAYMLGRARVYAIARRLVS